MTGTRTKAPVCPPGWSEPWEGTMLLQGLTPLALDNGPGFLPTYGFLAAGPQEHLGAVLGTDIIMIDVDQDGYLGDQHHLYRDLVTETTGCECGNPWTLCHPGA